MNQTLSTARRDQTERHARRRISARLAPVGALALTLLLVAAACAPGQRTMLEEADLTNPTGAPSGLPEVEYPTTDDASRTQVANIQVGDYSTMDEYLDEVVLDVDRYWSSVFARAGLPEPFVRVAWPAPGDHVVRSCTAGPGGSRLSDDQTASYCPLDEEIVISQQFAIDLWSGDLRGPDGQVADRAPGDFGVAYVVAHEYAHHLQDELELPQRLDLRQKAFELHADCWSGVWANSAYWDNELEAGDIEEAILTADLVGDSDFGSPDHHGTSDERVEAFMIGYDSGQPISCDTFLMNG